jgi:N-acyl amino acid synthase of PEP-CTERM/exosortase system
MEGLTALYDQHFLVVPANTAALLDEAHALRYQVYCIEHQFEDPAQQVGNREVDAHDPHSVHAVLIHRSTGRVVGCVRLILPSDDLTVDLPIRGLLGAADRERFDQFERRTTAEISRYAVSKEFRRRAGESLYPDVNTDLTTQDARRLMPHMSLGLIRGIARLAADQGITHVCAVMAPALLRLLEQFGLRFERLGPPIEYHGPRQPCIAAAEELLAGLAHERRDYHEVVDAEYRQRAVRRPGDLPRR